MHNKALLFDFDGVIADTFDFCFSISKQFNPSLTEGEYRNRFNGNIYDYLKTTEKIEKIHKNNNIDFWAEYKPRLSEKQLDPNIESAIRNLEKDYDLFIVSSTIGSAIRSFLEQNKILECFIEILGSDVHTSKINKIKTIQRKYSFSPENCMFITDIVGDIVEAKRCGVKSLAVSWGYHDEASLLNVTPVAVVNHPSELAFVIRSNFVP